MKADTNKLAYIGSLNNERDSSAWFTPSKYIEMARKVLGGIDLDPFSCDEANILVKAHRFFTETDSAFNRKWSETGKVTVWMNPPYGRGLMARAAEQFLTCFYNGEISRGIVLVNNATETQWFQELVVASNGICMVNRRISFYNIDGKNVSGNTRGQIFLYFDTREMGNFKDVFSTIGQVFLK